MNSVSAQTNASERCGPSNESVRGFLTLDELMYTEKEIIGFCQRSRFSNEFYSLQNGGTVKKSSYIFKLSPVLDDGVQRVGGPLGKSAMPEEKITSGAISQMLFSFEAYTSSSWPWRMKLDVV